MGLKSDLVDTKGAGKTGKSKVIKTFAKRSDALQIARRKNEIAGYSRFLVRNHKEKNPSELIKAGEWTPAHAIRIVKGRLEILK